MNFLKAQLNGKLEFATLQMKSGYASIKSATCGVVKQALGFVKATKEEEDGTIVEFTVPQGNYATIHTNFESIDGKGGFKNDTFIGIDGDKAMTGITKLGYLFKHTFIEGEDGTERNLEPELNALGFDFGFTPVSNKSGATVEYAQLGNDAEYMIFHSVEDIAQFVNRTGLEYPYYIKLRDENNQVIVKESPTGEVDANGQPKVRKQYSYVLGSVKPELINKYANNLSELINLTLVEQEAVFMLNISDKGNASFQAL